MATLNPETVPGIASRIVPGAPIPQPTGPAQWLELGRALDAELRAGFGIPANEHTVAVGWTSIPGLQARRFVGGSRRIRETAALPMPSPHLMAPRSNAQFLDHAEQLHAGCVAGIRCRHARRASFRAHVNCKREPDAGALPDDDDEGR
jgi:hypothetical protein